MSGMVFSTFDWDQLGKILQHSWKKYLKISSKVIHFESDLLKTNEDIAPQRRKIYRHLHSGSGGGGGSGGEGRGAASSCPPSYPPLIAALQKVEGFHYILIVHRNDVHNVQNIPLKLLEVCFL